LRRTKINDVVTDGMLTTEMGVTYGMHPQYCPELVFL